MRPTWGWMSPSYNVGAVQIHPTVPRHGNMGSLWDWWASAGTRETRYSTFVAVDRAPDGATRVRGDGSQTAIFPYWMRFFFRMAVRRLVYTQGREGCAMGCARASARSGVDSHSASLRRARAPCRRDPGHAAHGRGDRTGDGVRGGVSSARGPRAAPGWPPPATTLEYERLAARGRAEQAAQPRAATTRYPRNPKAESDTPPEARAERAQEELKP